jgi:pimeloyl-ACP methyl ester carboxylesterase/predicted glycosyltransferase
MGAMLDRDGVPIAWESHGDGTPPVLLLPAWAIVHSRLWKLQVPYLARHHRAITFDPRGNGASGRPDRPEEYADDKYVGDALAVLDAAGVDKALLVGLSAGGRWALQLAAAHPDRVLELLLIAPSVPLIEAAGKHEADAWSEDYRAFLDDFFAAMFIEPHSTRQIEDGVEWGLDIGPETLALTTQADEPERDWEELCRQISCPVTVVHGRRDRIVPYRVGREVARLTGGEFIRLDASGHGPHARRPVYANALIHGTAQRLAGRNGHARTTRRTGRRALFLSSPIGLGHARRDLAIARELRARVPDLRIDWLAQEPTAAVLRAAGERVHPMSAHLLGEADHIDAWRGDHELHVFESIRRMDEILLANYMVFRDLTRAERYDLWICDEAWEVDYHLHENPGDKRAPYAWLSDFVGWLPLPEHGEREAYLTADLNAEMIGHVEGPDAVRDLALFVGDPEDIVPDDFGPGLPSIREWTERHFEFTGQISEVGPAPPGGDEPLCLVTAGGSGVGEALLRRAVAALPELRRRVPGARMLVVCGPRIDPAILPAADGLEVVGYIPEIPACDVALAHGGLSTGMERVAAGTPFVSVPLRGHFEQMRHVRHRLERHGHGRTLLADEATPERLAAELAAALQTPPDYLPVGDDGAALAAARLAALL